MTHGDCIGIFAPSGPVRDQAKVEAGILILQELGFRTKQFLCPDTGCDYLAANDEIRADTFHSMLADDDVGALMALRGGYGCMRIMKMIDFDQIKSCPKYVVGFSDLSVLLNAIPHQTDVVTIHGPVLTSLAGSDDESINSLFSLLTDGMPQYFPADDITLLRPGTTQGVLRGGNLTTLIHLIGTPWEITWNKSVLLLEDTGEPMYRIDRMLTQLYYSGRLAQLSGIILGSFDSGEDTGKNKILKEQVWERVLELTENMDYPVWGDFPVGHQSKNHALPLGINVIMESKGTRLSVSTM
jgi:muramoyltetrapeptide carboxypeptidase